MSHKLGILLPLQVYNILLHIVDPICSIGLIAIGHFFDLGSFIDFFKGQGKILLPAKDIG